MSPVPRIVFPYLYRLFIMTIHLCRVESSLECTLADVIAFECISSADEVVSQRVGNIFKKFCYRNFWAEIFRCVMNSHPHKDLLSIDKY